MATLSIKLSGEHSVVIGSVAETGIEVLLLAIEKAHPTDGSVSFEADGRHVRVFKRHIVMCEWWSE